MSAIVNISSNEKTIKKMYTVLPDDNYNIDKILYYCKYDLDNNTEIQVELGNILDNYRDYFEKYLIEMDVPERFYYQPAAFAENYYGTPDLDFLVLYFANMQSLFDFKRPKIKVLNKTKLLELNRLFVTYKERVAKSYNEPTEYLRETFLKTY